MATMTTIREIKRMEWAAHMVLGSDLLIGVGASREAAVSALGQAIVSAVRSLRFSGEAVPDFSVADVWFENFLELITEYTEGPYLELLLENSERHSETTFLD
jgi:3-isopropylmalate dehydratase small subunit